MTKDAVSHRLEAFELAKSYNQRSVVKSVSINIQSGDIVGLLGPNGAGKTTCFYMIVGLVSNDSGQIKLDGRSIDHLPIDKRARQGIGYLPQEPSVFRNLSVEDNIKAVLQLRKDLNNKQRNQLLDSLLDDFQIGHIRLNKGITLSGGERRRVEIARALANEPLFILLDEPFAGVDPIAVGEIRTLVSALKKRGLGVLITDHNVRETLEIVDRAYILHDGKVLMSGTTKEIVEDENVKRVYLGENFHLG